MSVDLFVYKAGSAISAEELRQACRNIARRFPGVLIDTEWEATDQADFFPDSEAFFWQMERASVGLAEPEEAEDAEDFSSDGQSFSHFSHVHIYTNVHQFVFSEFLAHALALELHAEIFDPQGGEVIPVSPPSLSSLQDRHEAEIKQFSPVLKKEYRWLLPGDASKSAAENFESNTTKFNADLTAAMKAVFDTAFSGLQITRNTFSDLSDGLKLFASFYPNSEVMVLLTADLNREELFDRFANELAARFGRAFRSRQKYVFS